MRLAVAIIIILLMVCAALASNAHKPFGLRIDAQSPGVWPRYAQTPQMPKMVICYPMLIPHQKGPKRISRT